MREPRPGNSVGEGEAGDEINVALGTEGLTLLLESFFFFFFFTDPRGHRSSYVDSEQPTQGRSPI